jgi:predicted PurR-regulated permease PerM
MTWQQSLKATLTVLLTLLISYILISNVRILIVLVLAIIVASALRPLTLALTRIHIPYGLAITLCYVFLSIAIVVVLLLIVPPVVLQFANYLENESRLSYRLIVAQDWVEEQILSFSGQSVVLATENELRTTISHLLEQIRVTTPTILFLIGSVIGEAVLVFVIGVYWLTSRESVFNFIAALLPSMQRPRFKQIATEVETAMGNYVRGMLSVAIFVSVVNFAILSVFRVSNAATLAILIGATTLLPIVGGFVGAGSATLLALLVSPLQGLTVFLSFIVVQQLEMHIITPRVMSRSVGVDPLLVMLAVFLGFAMYGPAGAIIAVPLIGALAIVVKYYVVEPRQAELEYDVIDGGVLLPSASTPPKASRLQPDLQPADTTPP